MRAALLGLWLALAAPPTARADELLDCHRWGDAATQGEVRQALRQRKVLAARAEKAQCALWPHAAVVAHSDPDEAARLLERYRKATGSYEPPRWLEVDTRSVVDLALAFYQSHAHHALAIAVIEAQQRALEANSSRPGAEGQAGLLGWYLALLHIRQGTILEAAQALRRCEDTQKGALPPALPPVWGSWGPTSLGELQRKLRDKTIQIAGRLRQEGERREALRLVAGVHDISGIPYLRWHLAILHLELKDQNAAEQSARAYHRETGGGDPPPRLQDPGDAWGYQSLSAIQRAIHEASAPGAVATAPRAGSRYLLLAGAVLGGLGLTTAAAAVPLWALDGTYDVHRRAVLDGRWGIGGVAVGAGLAGLGLTLVLLSGRGEKSGLLRAARRGAARF